MTSCIMSFSRIWVFKEASYGHTKDLTYRGSTERMHGGVDLVVSVCDRKDVWEINSQFLVVPYRSV